MIAAGVPAVWELERELFFEDGCPWQMFHNERRKRAERFYWVPEDDDGAEDEAAVQGRIVAYGGTMCVLLLADA